MDDIYSVDDDGQLTIIEHEPEYSTTALAIIKKSNSLINRMGAVTLLSEKILLLALSNVRVMSASRLAGTREELYFKDIAQKTGTNFSEGLISVFSNSELRKALGVKSGSYYEQIDRLMNGTVFTNSWNIIYKDKDIIGHTNLVMGTVYDKRTGKIYIKWNSDMADRITDLKSNYTELDREIMFRFRSIYGYSIYQLLRSKLAFLEAVDKKKGLPVQEEYCVQYNLSEFKFLSGIISFDTTSKKKGTQDAIRQLEQQNYEVAEELLPDTEIYVRYADLKRYALDKAYMEINGFPEPKEAEQYYLLCQAYHKTDIHYRYSPVRSGRGGRVTGVNFYISWDKPGAMSAKKEDDSLDKDAILDAISELIQEPLKIKEMKLIAEAAKWDLQKVEKAYAVAKSQNECNNLVGFLISAIKNDYNAPIHTKGKGRVRHDFTQRDYSAEDFETIEQELLRSSRKEN